MISEFLLSWKEMGGTTILCDLSPGGRGQWLIIKLALSLGKSAVHNLNYILSPMIKLSKAAASEIRRLQSRRQNLEAQLRLGVQRGGCAELYYTIDFEEVMKAGDRVYECDGIAVIVDEKSLKHITGLTLDYSEDLMGGGFRFHNPNAVESCGCGNSFRVEQ